MKGYQKTNTKAQDLTEIVYKQNGFLSGLNTDNPKSDVGDTQVPVLENLIPYRDRLETRGGLKPNTNFVSADSSDSFSYDYFGNLYYHDDWDAIIHNNSVSHNGSVYTIEYMHGMTTAYDDIGAANNSFAKIGNKLVISNDSQIVLLEKRSAVLYVIRPLSKKEGGFSPNLVLKLPPGTIQYSFRCSYVRKINGVIEAESNASNSQLLSSSTALDGTTNNFALSTSTIDFPSDWNSPDGGYENFYTHIRFYRSKEGTGITPGNDARNSTHYWVGDYDLSLGLPSTDIFLDLNISDDDLTGDSTRVALWTDGYDTVRPSYTIEASGSFLLVKNDYIYHASYNVSEFVYTPMAFGDNQKYFGWYNPLFQYGSSINGEITCIRDLGSYCIITTRGRTYYVDTANITENDINRDLGIYTPILGTSVLVDDTVGIELFHRNASVKISQGEIISFTSDGEIRKFSNFKWGIDLARGKVHSITKGKILREELSVSAVYVNDAYWFMYRETNPLYANYQILNTLRLGTTEESGYGFTVITSAPETKGDYLNAGGWPYNDFIEAPKGAAVRLHSIRGVLNVVKRHGVSGFGNSLLEYTGDSFDRKLNVDIIDSYTTNPFTYEKTTYNNIESKVEFPEITASSESYFLYLLKSNFFLRKDRFSYKPDAFTYKGYEITDSNLLPTSLEDATFNSQTYIDESETVVSECSGFVADGSVYYPNEVQGKRIRINLNTSGGSFQLTGMEATFKRDKRKDVRDTVSSTNLLSLSSDLFCHINKDMENITVPIGRSSNFDIGAPIEGSFMGGLQSGVLTEGSAYSNNLSPTGEVNSIELAAYSVYEFQLPEKKSISKATIMFWYENNSSNMSIKTGWNSVYVDTITSFQLSKVNGTWVIENGIGEYVYTLPVLTEAWNHVAFVAKGGDEWDVYLNGTLSDSTSSFTLLSSINSNSLVISGEGEFYDLRMYSKELSANEIKFYYDEIMNNEGDLFYGY